MRQVYTTANNMALTEFFWEDWRKTEESEDTIFGKLKRQRLKFLHIFHTKNEEWRPAKKVKIKCENLEINSGWLDSK